MQTNRILGVGLLILIVAALAVWQFGFAGGQPALPTIDPAATAGAPAAPASGAVETSGKSEGAAPATLAGTDQRTAVPAEASIDDSKAAVVGRVVGPDGQPIAGATIYSAPGMGFANANGNLDFDTFDFADFDEVESTDPSRMMTLVREQLALRVETKTNAEGRFRVHAKGTSNGVGLRVLARGHAILDRRVARPAEQDVDVGTLSLQKSAIVAGRVLDPSGEPIADARVSRVHEMEARMMGGIEIDMPEMSEVEALRGGEVSTTDKDGRFELLHLAAGDLTLRSRHPDHPTAKSATMQLEPGRELRDVLVTMQRGGEIRGVVLGMPADTKGLQVMASKKPRADADPTGMMAMFGGDMADVMADMGMSMGERSADIAPDGKFVLRGLAREPYRVWVGRTATGFGFAGNGMCSARVEAQPGGSVELQYEPGVSVTFTVVDAKSGAPIERLWVKDQLRGGGGWADMMAGATPAGKQAHYPAGSITVANLRAKPKQKLTLTIEANGHDKLERADIELPKTGNLDLGTLKLEPAPVLQVTVLAFDDKRPVAGATVRLGAGGANMGVMAFGRFAGLGASGGGPSSGKSDREGRCSINRPVDGSVVVEVEAKGFAPFTSESLTFTKEGPDTFTARLHVGGGVDVTVVDAEDKPVKDAVVEHRAPGGGTATKKSDAQGAVHFTALAPGKHEFRLGKDAGPMAMFAPGLRDGSGDDEAWQGVEVADRTVLAVRLVKKPTAVVRGVVRENGVPLAGARVSFREGVGSDNEGDFAAQAMADMMGAVGGAASARNGKTDDRGAYQLAELPEGEHRLHITHKGRAMPTLVAVALRNGSNVVDVELDMTTVRGLVKDPEGNPVDGARVKVKKAPKASDTGPDMGRDVGDAMEGMMPGMNLGGGSTIKTDASGNFELRGVDPDVELLVQVTAKGFAPASTKVTAARGTTVQAPALQLGAAGRIKVTVATDMPFAAVHARFLGEGDAVPPVFQLLRKGKATLDGLRPGSWEVEFQGMDRSDPNAPERKRTVEVVAGQTIDVEL